jgi:hypothetical protein
MRKTRDLLERLRDHREKVRREEIMIEIDRLRSQARMRLWIVVFTAFMSATCGSAATVIGMSWAERGDRCAKVIHGNDPGAIGRILYWHDR